MASNTFGRAFQVTTFGESHGSCVGCVIDGCPSGLEISEEEITTELARRAPGRSPYTSPRKEADCARILSGLYEGKTTGAPIAIVIDNVDADSTKYRPIEHLLRPGHANYTYQEKYGHFDPRGGGRASARETAARVAAGAIASKLLRQREVEVEAALCEVGGQKQEWEALLEQAMEEGDSLGGVVEAVATGVPAGWGDPVYEKLEARLAYAMMGIPAARGFEIGSGFAAARMRGSHHNDPFTSEEGKIATTSNHCGGVLGGIANGMPIVVRVAFKPTSSIAQSQSTVTKDGEAATLTLPKGSRHDPCLALRAPPIVEAMMALVLVDCALS